MQSFANHRKSQLRSRVYLESVRDSINLQFDILRIDLLETVKLPELLFEGSVDSNASYNLAKKDDYDQCRLIVENAIAICKSHFYETIMEEAVAIAANPLVSFQTELLTKVREMIKLLKDKVTAALGVARSTSPAADPTADASRATSPTAEPTVAPDAASGLGATSPAKSFTRNASPDINIGSMQRNASPDIDLDAGKRIPATSRTGSSFRGTHDDDTETVPHNEPLYPGTQFPRDKRSGHKPADYDTWRPSDGYRAGAGRVLRGLLSGIPGATWLRRKWHGHPVRPMAKEHFAYIENLLVENTDQILQMIDDFGKELEIYITDRIKTIGGDAVSGSPTSPLAPAAKVRKPKVDKEGNPVPGTETPAPHTVPMGGEGDLGRAAPETPPSPAEAPEATDPHVAKLDGTTPTEQKADAGDPDAKELIKQNQLNFKVGCGLVGIDVGEMRSNLDVAKKLNLDKMSLRSKKEGEPSLPLHGVKATGASRAKRPMEKGALGKLIYDGLYEKLLGQQAPETQGLSKHVRSAVDAKLGITQPRTDFHYNEVILQLLLRAGQLVRTGKVTPAVPKSPSLWKGDPTKTAGGPPVMTPTAKTAAPTGAGKTDVGLTSGGSPSNVPMNALSDEATTGWSADPNAFIAKFKKDYPQGWKEFSNLHGSDEGATQDIANDLEDVDEDFTPDDIFDNIARTVNKKAGKGLLPVRSTTPAPTAPITQEKPAAATTQLASEKGLSPTLANTAKADTLANTQQGDVGLGAKPNIPMSKAKSFRSGLEGTLETHPHLKHVLDSMTDDELETILAPFADPESKEALSAVFKAYASKATKNAGTAPAETEAPAEKTPPAPEEIKGKTVVPKATGDEKVASANASATGLPMPENSLPPDYEFNNDAINAVKDKVPSEVLKQVIAGYFRTKGTAQSKTAEDSLLQFIGTLDNLSHFIKKKGVAEEPTQAAATAQPVAGSVEPAAEEPATEEPAAQEPEGLKDYSTDELKDFANRLIKERGGSAEQLKTLSKEAQSQNPKIRGRARTLLGRLKIPFNINFEEKPKATEPQTIAPGNAEVAPEGEVAPAAPPELTPGNAVVVPQAPAKKGKKGKKGKAAELGATVPQTVAPPAAEVPANAPAIDHDELENEMTKAGKPYEEAQGNLWKSLRDMYSNDNDEKAAKKQATAAVNALKDKHMQKILAGELTLDDAIEELISMHDMYQSDDTNNVGKKASKETIEKKAEKGGGFEQAAKPENGETEEQAQDRVRAKAQAEKAEEEYGDEEPTMGREHKGKPKGHKPQRGGGRRGHMATEHTDVFQSVLDNFLTRMVENTSRPAKLNAKQMLMFA